MAADLQSAGPFSGRLKIGAHNKVIHMSLSIEIEREEDGRWIAEVPELLGILVYGKTRREAIERVQALTFRVLADRLENKEKIPDLEKIFSVVSNH